MSDIDKFLTDHLKLWKDSGVPAPANELQSIQAWLRHLGQHGAEETKNAMRLRMLLLMNAVNELAAGGEEAEDAAGIYERRSRAEMSPPNEPPKRLEGFSLVEFRDRLLSASDEMLDPEAKAFIRKWDDTTTALQVLYVLDICVHASLTSDFVISMLNVVLGHLLAAEGTTHEELQAKATWRTK